MSGPYLHLGLWQPRPDGADLLDRTLRALAGRGATVRRDGGRATADRLPGTGRTAEVETLPAAEGALVAVTVAVDDLDVEPAERWHPLVATLAAVVLAVRPALATLAVEEPPDALPDPSRAEAETLFSAGWADLAALPAAARAEFEQLAGRGRAELLGPGVWWGADPALWPHPTSAAAPAATLAAWRAWATGRGTPAGDVPDEWAAAEPARAQGELWFWSAADAGGLAHRVPDALGEGFGTVTGPGDEPGWVAVISAPERPTPTEGLVAVLAELLEAVGDELAADWAAVQPDGGVAVPGPDEELPQTGVLTHPWARTGWLGDLAPDLGAALAGCARLEVAGGTFWVTDPALELPADGGWVAATDPDGWGDPGVRRARLTAAAAVLGEAARRSAGIGGTARDLPVL